MPNSEVVEEDDDVDIFPEARSFSSISTEKMNERMKEFSKPTESVKLDVEDISQTQSD